MAWRMALGAPLPNGFVAVIEKVGNPNWEPFAVDFKWRSEANRELAKYVRRYLHNGKPKRFPNRKGFYRLSNPRVVRRRDLLARQSIIGCR